MTDLIIEQQIHSVTNTIETAIQNDLLGVYLFGSYVHEGLRPNSDLDFLVIVKKKLSKKTKQQLIKSITPLSKRTGEENDFRYIELTIIDINQVNPWSYPPKQDFIYGEWLYEDYQKGYIPKNEVNPDLAVLLYKARISSQTLLGQYPLKELVPKISLNDVRKAIIDSIDFIWAEPGEDQANTLLTLCRMLLTYKDGKIYSKDQAGKQVLKIIPPQFKKHIQLAITEYLEGDTVNWDSERNNIDETVAYLKNELIRIS